MMKQHQKEKTTSSTESKEKKTVKDVNEIMNKLKLTKAVGHVDIANEMIHFLNK